MPHAVEQSKTGTGTSSAVTVTLDSPSSSGNMIEVTVSGRVGATAPGSFAITDNKGNTYSLVVQSVGWVNTFGQSVAKYRAYNITGGASHEITATPTNIGSGIGVIAAEHSGLTTTDPNDQSAASSNFGGSISSGNTGTLAQADELVTCGAFNRTGSDMQPGSGYTEIASDIQSISKVSDEYKVVAATTAVAGTWSDATVASWGCVVATYLIAAGGGGGTHFGARVNSPILKSKLGGLAA